jgi:hypothetical protein
MCNSFTFSILINPAKFLKFPPILCHFRIYSLLIIPYTSQAVTINNDYYIKVTPDSRWYGGAYRITFNASPTPPPSISLPTANVTLLDSNTWASGNITANGGVQWFKFTSTDDATQYIHFEPGTLGDVYVQIYDITGVTVKSRTNLYSSARYTSQTVTNDSVYYIRVTPYNGTGTYRIAFNTATTAPAQ